MRCQKIGKLGKLGQFDILFRAEFVGRYRLGNILADRRQHALKQTKRLLLIFVDWVLLCVRPQIDNLTQSIER